LYLWNDGSCSASFLSLFLMAVARRKSPKTDTIKTTATRPPNQSC
jgi:hypothetical protein